MINWGRLARHNRRGVSKSAKPKVKTKVKPRTRKSPKVIRPKIIKPKVTRMSNEKPKPKKEQPPKKEPEKKQPEKKEKYQEPIGQEVKSEVVKPSGAALERVKELEASTPEAIAAAREKTQAKPKTK
jgi:hypothetical protein